MNSPTLAHKIPFSMCRLIYIPVPDYEARLAILNIKLANKVAKNVNIPLLARDTEWYTGADLEGLVQFAVKLSVRRKVRAAIEDAKEKRRRKGASKEKFEKITTSNNNQLSPIRIQCSYLHFSRRGRGGRKAGR